MTMGIYLNPGNDKFKKACNSAIYIDKTGLIELTNEVMDTEQNCIYISRARRFGKSMAANMLVAYYGKECDSRELFDKYKIAEKESYRENLNQYNVIALNIQNFLSVVSSKDELIAYIQSEILGDNIMWILRRKRNGMMDMYFPMTCIYNPKSVVDSIRRKKLQTTGHKRKPMKHLENM